MSFYFLFLLPDGVGVDRIIEPQDVQTEKPHNQGVHSWHQSGDEHTHIHKGSNKVVNMVTV